VLPSLVACVSGESRPAPESRPPRASDRERVAAAQWRLVALEGEPPIAGVDVTLAFDGGERVFGHAGANRWFAAVEHADDGTFVTSAAASTRMFRAEPPGLMEQESRYLDLLSRVRRFRLDGERLELLAGERVLLAFEPAG
jgi:heat shock protein HslJ